MKFNWKHDAANVYSHKYSERAQRVAFNFWIFAYIKSESMRNAIICDREQVNNKRGCFKAQPKLIPILINLGCCANGRENKESLLKSTLSNIYDNDDECKCD